MKLEVKVSQDALSRVSRMFNNTLSSVLAELIQNARRAGATQLQLETEQADVSQIKVRLTHDGRPFSEADLQASFSLGASGWDAAVENEDPAGFGLFSLSACSDIVLVSVGVGEDTSGFSVAFQGEDLTRGGFLDIRESTERPEAAFDANVSITFAMEAFTVEHEYAHNLASHHHTSVVQTLRYCGLKTVWTHDGAARKVTTIEDEIEAARAAGLILHQETAGGCVFTFVGANAVGCRATRLECSLYGVRISQQGILPVSMSAQIPYDCLFITSTPDCKVHVVLPGRYTLVEDAELAAFQKATSAALANLANRVGHELSFAQREQLQEETGVVIQDSKVPAAYACQDALAVVNTSDGCLLEVLQAADAAISIVTSGASDPYAGYAWNTKLRKERKLVDSDVLYILMSKEEAEPAGPWPCEDLLALDAFNEPVTKAGGLYKHFALCLKDLKTGMCDVVCRPRFLVWVPYGDALYGYVEDTIQLAFTPDVGSSEIHDAVCAVWEPSDGCESESASSQENELRDSLSYIVARYLGPEAQALNSTEVLMGSWDSNFIEEALIRTKSGKYVRYAGGALGVGAVLGSAGMGFSDVVSEESK